MRSVQYRRWCPPQSPVRIEFPAELLAGLQPPAGSLENSGILYGFRRGPEIRVLTARPEPGEVLESVGVFVSRSRGEVFLTEANLGFFEREGAAVALVIAGAKAGFFVRESDESIQTVRSHEEFPVLNHPPSPEQKLLPPKPVAGTSKWTWFVSGLIALVTLPVAAFAYLRPVFPQRPLAQLSMKVQEDQNQLHISWNNGGNPGWNPGGQAILQIVDGAERTTAPVYPDQSNVTYARRTSEVQINLIPLDGEPTRRESAHFVGQPLPAPPTAQLSSEIEQSRTEVDRLRAEAAAINEHIASLQKAIARLTSKPTSKRR